MPVGLEPARGRGVKRTRSVRSEPARAPTGGRSRCVFARQMRGYPHRLSCSAYEPVSPRDAGSFLTRRRGSKLRWNSSCFGSLSAHLGTIPPQRQCYIFRWKNVVGFESHRPYHVIACEPVFPRDAGSLLLDAGGTRTREGASVKRTRSVRSEPARAPTGGRSRCVFARQMRGYPTAPIM